MVDRYRSLGARMLQEPHGAYVAHADYESLEAETQRKIDILKSEIARVTDIAGDALGFSEYQRDQDTVEVLANHAKRLAKELTECKDFRKGTIHNAWITALREKLIEALQFQGATTKEYMEENAALRARCERLVDIKSELLDGVKEIYRVLKDDGRFSRTVPELEVLINKALEVPRG